MAKKSYNTMQTELEELLDWFNSEDVDIDKAVDKYQQAQGLLAEMEKYLKTAENKIQTIKLSIKE